MLTHRSVALAEPVRAEPAGAAETRRAEPRVEHPRRIARLHRAARPRFAGEPSIGDYVPDDVPLRALPGDTRRFGFRGPYRLVVEDERLAYTGPGYPGPSYSGPSFPGPWGARPAYDGMGYRPAYMPPPYPGRVLMVP